MNDSKQCIQCNQIFYNPKNGSKRWKITKFCSHKCYWKSLEGKPITSWTKNRIEKIRKANFGKKHSEESKKKMGCRMENHPKWKGDNVGVIGVHAWLWKIKGKASDYKCVDCNKQARDWSNKNHSYKRKLSDYEPRCIKCHRQYDIKFNNYNKPSQTIICGYCNTSFTVRYGERYRKYCSEKCYHLSKKY